VYFDKTIIFGVFRIAYIGYHFFRTCTMKIDRPRQSLQNLLRKM